MNVSHSAGFRARLKYAGVFCEVEQFVSPASHNCTVCCSWGCLPWAVRSCRDEDFAFSLKILWGHRSECCSQRCAESHIDTKKSNEKCHLAAAVMSLKQKRWIGGNFPCCDSEKQLSILFNPST